MTRNALYFHYRLIDMLDSDWCIVGSKMTVVTLDVNLELNSISNWFMIKKYDIAK